MSSKKQAEDRKKVRTSYGLKLTPAQMDRLEEIGKEKGWPSREVPYARFSFTGPQVNITGYESGKFLAQGKGTEEFVTHILEPMVTGEAKLGYDEVHHPEWFEPHAGLDESGKGDLFGPLVSAAVVAEAPAIRHWMEEGIKDSKTISEGGIKRLDRIIRKTRGVSYALVQCGMTRYNELMSRPGANLNKLLAWQHARALEEALEKKWVPWGMLDQFSKRPLTQGYLRAENFDLRMMTKAEADPVVAAASVLARAEYVRQMEKLGEVAGEPLLKGAGPLVKEQGFRLVEKWGPQKFGDFAKLHFKTAREILGEA